jgi:hypothetical protein
LQKRFCQILTQNMSFSTSFEKTSEKQSAYVILKFKWFNLNRLFFVYFEKKFINFENFFLIYRFSKKFKKISKIYLYLFCEIIVNFLVSGKHTPAKSFLSGEKGYPTSRFSSQHRRLNVFFKLNDNTLSRLGKPCPAEILQRLPCPYYPCVSWVAKGWYSCSSFYGTCGNGIQLQKFSCISARNESTQRSLCQTSVGNIENIFTLKDRQRDCRIPCDAELSHSG